MKRFFICAAAAIVALASCSKTQVVYNDAPEEIGFKAVSGVMTKAPIEDGILPTEKDMVVFASKSAEAAGTYSPYFSNATFAWNNTGSYWSGGKYWPESGYLKFIAYYPAGNGTYVSGDATSSILFEGVNAASGDDILYTELTAAYDCASSPTVPMPFLHALAQVQVTAKVSDANMTGVKVTNVVLTGAPMTGDLTITEDNATWDNQVVGTEVTMDNDITGVNLTAAAITLGEGTLVVPDTHSATLTVTYTVDGLVKTTDALSISGTWEKGKKYIYALSIGLEEIKLSATVGDWDTDLDGDDVADDDIPVDVN